jgi:Rieske 2Fe-2S family protein
MREETIPTYKLPPQAYYDEAWLEQEKLKIFGGSWQFAGLESEVSQPGCYKTIKAGLDELVVVRDKRGNLNAFHNVCRHRGAQLVQGAGKCGTLVCPYHKWAYGLDGKMRGVAKREQFGDLEPEKLGLHAASAATWMGLVFVHPDGTPTTTLDDWLMGIKTELSVFDVTRLQLLKSDHINFDANWKLYIENHIDWLHLWFVHPETLGALSHEFGEVKQHGLHWTSYDPVKDENRSAFQSSSPLPEIPHLKDQASRYSETGAHFVFPNLPVFTGSSFFVTADLVPLSAEKTRMNINVLGMPGGDVDEFLSLFNTITKGEDAGIVENIQKNVRNKRFSVGPIAPAYEKAIADFHDNYLELMG